MLSLINPLACISSSVAEDHPLTPWLVPEMVHHWPSRFCPGYREASQTASQFLIQFPLSYDVMILAPTRHCPLIFALQKGSQDVQVQIIKICDNTARRSNQGFVRHVADTIRFRRNAGTMPHGALQAIGCCKLSSFVKTLEEAQHIDMRIHQNRGVEVKGPSKFTSRKLTASWRTTDDFVRPGCCCKLHCIGKVLESLYFADVESFCSSSIARFEVGQSLQ